MPIINALTAQLSNLQNPITPLPNLKKPITTLLPNTQNPITTLSNSQTPPVKMDEILQKLNAVNNKLNTVEQITDTVKNRTNTLSQWINDLVFTYFDTEKSYGGLYFTGHILLGIFVWLPVTMFGIVTTLLWFLFLAILFLLIFIPLMLIGIVFMILILVMIKIWFFGKTFMDALIKTINPIIPVPLFIWNIIAKTINGIGKALKTIGVRMKKLPVVGNPNSYKIKKGVMSIYDIVDLVFKPLKKQALRKIEENL